MRGSTIPTGAATPAATPTRSAPPTRVARWIALGLAAVVMTTQAAPASAQEAPTKPNPGGAFIGAVALGFAGFFAGARLGSMGDCYEICDNLVRGALVGQALGVPIGAHVGNAARGSLAADLGVSLLTLGLGVAGSSAASDGSFYLVATLAQVGTVVATEITTSPDVAVSAGPRLVGDELGVGVSIRW